MLSRKIAELMERDGVVDIAKAQKEYGVTEVNGVVFDLARENGWRLVECSDLRRWDADELKSLPRKKSGEEIGWLLDGSVEPSIFDDGKPEIVERQHNVMRSRRV